MTGSTENGYSPELVARLRRILAIVVAANLGYFFIEITVALLIGSVSLFADSVDFLEDAAVNTLILIALGWPLARRAIMGRVMAVIIVLPALAAAWQAISKFNDPTPPQVFPLLITAGGALVVNTICAWLLAGYQHHGGSMTKAAFLAARNDVIVNAAIIAMAAITWWVGNGWPDIVLGIIIIVLNFSAAKEVLEAANEERLAAKALAGDFDDD